MLELQSNSKQETSPRALLNASKKKKKKRLKVVYLKNTQDCMGICQVVCSKVRCYIQYISQKIKSIVPKSGGA